MFYAAYKPVYKLLPETDTAPVRNLHGPAIICA